MTVELQEALRLRARQLSKNVSDLSPADIDYVGGLMDKSSDSSGGSQALFAQALQIRADQLSMNVRDFTQADRDYVQELLDEGSLVVPKPKTVVSKPVINEPAATGTYWAEVEPEILVVPDEPAATLNVVSEPTILGEPLISTGSRTAKPKPNKSHKKKAS